jgi:amino acid transporter
MMTLPWGELDGSAALAVASKRVLPNWIVIFIAVSALLAAGTSISGNLMAQSRDVLVASESGLIPRFFSKVSDGIRVPVRATMMLGVLCLLAIYYGA